MEIKENMDGINWSGPGFSLRFQGGDMRKDPRLGHGKRGRCF